MRRALALLVVSAGLGAAQSGDDIVLRALTDEVKRAASDLRLEDLPRPYYVDYTVLESDTYSGAAVFGGLARSRRYRSRSQHVNVRVGDYRLDNTNFAGGGFRPGAYDVYSLPLEDDYGVLRRHFWLSADEAYKGAVEALARKSAALRNINLPVRLNDFAKQPAVEQLAPPARLAVDQKAWEGRLRELSALFRRYPRITRSRVEFEASAGNRYLVNSEGSRVRDPEVLYLLQAFATAQAADGSRLSDAVWLAARQENLLGSSDFLRTQVEEMAKRLTVLAEAAPLESYSGPVLFEGTAAAQIFAEFLGRNLAVTRQPLSAGRGGMGARAGGLGGSLDGRRKSRILPEWMDVFDDPSQTEWRGQPLLGHYAIDVEGVRAQRVDLIRRGVLENYLLSRLPVRGFEGSNGHGRLPGPAGTTFAMPGNLFVEARQTVPEADLKKQLLDMCRAQDREFGLLIRKMDFPSAAAAEDLRNLFSGQGQDESPSSLPLAVYKIYVADGREEPVRGLRLQGFSVRSFKDILAAGDAPVAFHFIDNGAAFAQLEGSFGVETTVVAPSVLVDDVELRGGEGQRPNLPVVPHPYFSARSN